MVQKTFAVFGVLSFLMLPGAFAGDGTIDVDPSKLAPFATTGSVFLQANDKTIFEVKDYGAEDQAYFKGYVRALIDQAKKNGTRISLDLMALSDIAARGNNSRSIGMYMEDFGKAVTVGAVNSDPSKRLVACQAVLESTRQQLTDLQPSVVDQRKTKETITAIVDVIKKTQSTSSSAK